MLIGIDASKAATAKKTGIDNTAYQIILNLAKFDKENDYYLYTPKPLDDDLKSSNFKERLIPFARLWHKFRLPLALFKDKPSVFLELTSSIPPLAPEKSIVLIHDLAFKFFPEVYSPFELQLQENAIKVAIKKAKKIVFSLEANAKDFLKFYPIPSEKIEIIPLAYDETTYRKNNEKIDFLELNGMPFFLYVGRIEKRKNVGAITESFEKFKKSLKANHKLVLVGKNGYGHEEIDKKIEQSEFKEDIILPGYLSDEQLATLYSKTEAFLYPSLYEGFGLPILEAFGCGAPVISSDVPTIRELSQGACLLVDPTNTTVISETMAKIVTDKDLREDLIKKGILVAKKYSWEKTAEKYYELIKAI